MWLGCMSGDGLVQEHFCSFKALYFLPHMRFCSRLKMFCSLYSSSSALKGSVPAEGEMTP